MKLDKMDDTCNTLGAYVKCKEKLCQKKLKHDLNIGGMIALGPLGLIK
jgi:hypothetical protein